MMTMKKVIWSKGWISAFFIGLLLFSGPLRAQNQDGDFLLWLTQNFIFKPADTPKLSFELENQTRLENNATEFDEFVFVPAVSYKILSWFSVAFRNALFIEGGGVSEYRPTLEAKLTKSLGNWKLGIRNRFENRILKDAFRFRYRLRGGFAYGIKGDPVSFEPYLNNEFFFQNQGGYNQNRAAVGNQFIFLKGKISVALYYMLRSDKRDTGWIHRHILGQTFNFQFP